MKIKQKGDHAVVRVFLRKQQDLDVEYDAKRHKKYWELLGE